MRKTRFLLLLAALSICMAGQAAFKPPGRGGGGGGGGKRSLFRFNLSGVVFAQMGAIQYSGALAWNPTVIRSGSFGFDLLGEGMLAKADTNAVYGILSGGGVIRWDLGGSITLQAGGVVQYWTITGESLFAPYGALLLYWNKGSWLSGLSLAYSLTAQRWGPAHHARAGLIISL
ncbi:hypothetical protein K2X33_08025 [bacterium]|nr:hypothetical protein [bacterium]